MLLVNFISTHKIYFWFMIIEEGGINPRYDMPLVPKLWHATVGLNYGSLIFCIYTKPFYAKSYHKAYLCQILFFLLNSTSTKATVDLILVPKWSWDFLESVKSILEALFWRFYAENYFKWPEIFMENFDFKLAQISNTRSQSEKRC